MTHDEMINMPTGQLLDYLAVCITLGEDDKWMREACDICTVASTLRRDDAELIRDGFLIPTIEMVRNYVFVELEFLGGEL